MFPILAQSLPALPEVQQVQQQVERVPWSPTTPIEWFGTVAGFSVMGMVLLIVFIIALDKIVLPKFNLTTAMNEKNMAAAVFFGSCVIAVALVISKAIGM